MTQAKNFRKNTLRENHCSGVLADQPLSKGGHGISTGLWNKRWCRWCTEKYDFCRKEPDIDESYYWWNVELTLHFSPCCMYNSGYKSPEENKVNGPRSPKKLGHPVSFLISFPIFLHLPTSSILRISLDSAEAGPRHQTMLSIWSLVPLPFLKPAWTSGNSQFMYCWSLTWRILSITLLACEMSAIVR